MSETGAHDALMHARLRWVGAALLPFGFASLLAHAWAVTHDLEPRGRLMLGVFSTLVSLGAFGSNDDSMLACARRARDTRRPLAASVALDLGDEMRRRPARVREAPHHPRTARVLPLVALGAVLWSWWRVGQVLGWLG